MNELSALRQLAGLGSDRLGPPLGEQSPALADLLTEKNGFYAFEAALHVFPSGSTDSGVTTLEAWNAEELWRSSFDGMADGLLFFAEDIFGVQFALAEDKVFTFDPETGETSFIATGLDEWAAAVLEDYRLLTGYPVAHDWQIRNGQLAAGQRLVPRVPFVLGGQFEPANLVAIAAADGMRARARLARQIRDLPDGTPISYEPDASQV